MRPTETNRRFNLNFIVCVLVVAFVMTTNGCNVLDRFNRKPEPKVITVPDQMVPKKLDEGEPAPYDGWHLSTPLFNEYAPYWQKGPFEVDDE